MTPQFLRRKELGPFLGMTQAQALAILDAHGVRPVDLGKGRGHGLRWRTSAVIRVADALHAEAQAQPSTPHRPRISHHPVRGRTAEDLCAEFNRGGSGPVQ